MCVESFLPCVARQYRFQELEYFCAAITEIPQASDYKEKTFISHISGG
jgi:hypothetical protein